MEMQRKTKVGGKVKLYPPAGISSLTVLGVQLCFVRIWGVCPVFTSFSERLNNDNAACLAFIMPVFLVSLFSGLRGLFFGYC